MSPTLRCRLAWFVALALLLIAAFARPLGDLVRLASHSDLYSHILLIPFISAYLIWTKRREVDLEVAPTKCWWILPIVVGLGLLALYWSSPFAAWKPEKEDSLALLVLALLCLLSGMGLALLGASVLSRMTFPAAFLMFMIPFPAAVRRAIEIFFQRGSAEVAQRFFEWSGMPVLRHGMEFQLPGFALAVAPECSGIHSSLVLFITSLIAGWLFLNTLSRRVLLTLAVIPLALVRNGFRVFVIGELCVNVSPEMIHSPIHHHGGPLFFALSLIPFFVLLLLLRRSESRRRPNRADCP